MRHQMEDPVRFDLWGVVKPGQGHEAADWLSAQGRAGMSRLQILLSTNRSSGTGQPLLLASHLSWQEVQRIKGLALPWVEDLQIFLEHYTPDDQPFLDHCRVHDLFHGGCSGCHVCNDFYVR